MIKKYIIFLTVILIALCVIFPATGFSFNPVEEHRYLKTTGHEQINFDWRLMEEKPFKLETIIGSEVDITHMDDDLATVSWSVSDPDARTALNVVRSEDILIFSGQFNGEDIQRSVTINPAPWYQALSVSLREFNRSSEKMKKIWSIRPDTLDVHQLKIIREGDEIIQLGSDPCHTTRIKIQLTGFKSVFWSGQYWLRKEDGLFVRYEGPSGPPGWPLTTVTLQGPCID